MSIFLKIDPRYLLIDFQSPMSINVFLHRYTVHVPSVARARILPTVFLRKPMIYIDCHNGRDQEIVYPFGAWDKAKKDFESLEHEMNRCQTALADLHRKTALKEADSDSDS
jgi:hypothetical protein